MVLTDIIAIGKGFDYIQLYYQHSGRFSVFHDLLDRIA